MGNLYQHMPNFSAQQMSQSEAQKIACSLLTRYRHDPEPAFGVCRQMTTVEDAPAVVHAPERRIKILERPKETTGTFSWVTTVDHKKIAIMYATLALVLLRGRRDRGALHPAAARAARTARS